MRANSYYQIRDEEKLEEKMILSLIASITNDLKPDKFISYKDASIIDLLDCKIKTAVYGDKIEFEHNQRDNISFIDCEKNIQSCFYNVATLNFILSRIDNKEEQYRILKLLYDSLETNGYLIISEVHPCFLPYDNAFFKTNIQTEDFNYNKEGMPFTTNYFELKEKNSIFTNYNWKLSTWINMAINIGFDLVELKEIKDLDKGNSIPPYLVLILKKGKK